MSVYSPAGGKKKDLRALRGSSTCLGRRLSVGRKGWGESAGFILATPKPKACNSKPSVSGWYSVGNVG